MDETRICTIILPMDMETFEGYVADAIEALPPDFVDQIENVEVLVEEWPDTETLHAAGLRNRMDLMGFYWGVPLTERGENYNLVLPDRISLYRQPILLYCRQTGHDLKQTVARVLRHEIAHYFGIDDDRLEELGAY